MRLKTKRNAALMLSFFSALGWNLPAPSPVTAATIGNTGLVNFSAIVVSSYCDIITNVNGALAVTKNRKQITSDISLPGPFTGTPSAATFSVTSNLDSLGFVIVDGATLSGTTAATLNQVRVNSNPIYANTEQIALDTNGSLGPTTVNVKFETTNNNDKFANSTYTASATLTCTDDGTK